MVFSPDGRVSREKKRGGGGREKQVTKMERNTERDDRKGERERERERER